MVVTIASASTASLEPAARAPAYLLGALGSHSDAWFPEADLARTGARTSKFELNGPSRTLTTALAPVLVHRYSKPPPLTS